MHSREKHIVDKRRITHASSEMHTFGITLLQVSSLESLPAAQTQLRECVCERASGYIVVRCYEVKKRSANGGRFGKRGVGFFFPAVFSLE